MAMEEGALMVQISQHLFLAFIASKPRTLQIYLQKVVPATLITYSCMQVCDCLVVLRSVPMRSLV